MMFDPLKLPCGVVLKNRIVKSAMSDSLGDGTGHPTDAQGTLYRQWADGGVAASIIGEVQLTHEYAEKPGNLVLNDDANLARFIPLADAGAHNGALLWLQLGHAGALSYAPTSMAKGPSVLDLDGLKCGALSVDEIAALPAQFARTAVLAQKAGFGGVQIHAGHGFLLSQFLSPLFNHRDDEYGGSIENRMLIILDVIAATRAAVGPSFPIAIKINSSDQLEGGLIEDDALRVVAALDHSSIDLIDISGGTYFPGAKAASDGGGAGPYFIEFAKRARGVTCKPLMLTGGFKTRVQVEDALKCVDVVGLARAMAIHPDLPNQWAVGELAAPKFPRFDATPEGGITAWYTMRLTEIGTGEVIEEISDLHRAIEMYEERDAQRTAVWLEHFNE
jgi:2,4-dienoyl-CoA reductase-like NADH-dependent reductase (Old Yellow Enzyme family)